MTDARNEITPGAPDALFYVRLTAHLWPNSLVSGHGKSVTWVKILAIDAKRAIFFDYEQVRDYEEIIVYQQVS